MVTSGPGVPPKTCPLPPASITRRVPLRTNLRSKWVSGYMRFPFAPIQEVIRPGLGSNARVSLATWLRQTILRIPPREQGRVAPACASADPGDARGVAAGGSAVRDSSGAQGRSKQRIGAAVLE